MRRRDNSSIPRCAILIASWILRGAVLSAQGRDASSIVGRVVDGSGAAVIGVAVSATSPALIGGARHAVTNEAGIYRLTGLTAGVYRIEARTAGFDPAVRGGIDLPAATTLTVDFALTVARVAQVVSVVAASPMVDVKTAESPVHVGSFLIANLPTNRVLSDVMNLTPGVNGSLAYGGVQKSNQLIVDGVNTSDAAGLTPWSAFNYNWIDDVETVGLGAGAEYGEFSGIVQKAYLKTGSNSFHGLGEYRTTRPSWVGTNTGSLPASTVAGINAQTPALRILQWRDISVQAGGPVVLNRLWFFAGLQDFVNDAKPALVTGSGSTAEHARRLLAKADAAPATAVRVAGFYEHDRYRLRGDGLSAFTPLEATTTDTQPNHNWNARITWTPDDRTTMQVETYRSSGVQTFDPTAPATRSGPYPHFDSLTGVSSGNTSGYLEFGSMRQSIGGRAARYVAAAHGGSHELAVGFEHERSRTTSVSGSPGGRYFIDFNGAPSRVFLRQENRQRADAQRTTAYLEDDWSAGRGITLQPGVRVSVNRGSVAQDQVFATDPVSPRVGLAWDVGRDHRTVVRAHYGRYHEALLTSQFGFLDPARLDSVQITAQVVGPEQFVELSRTTPASLSLDPDFSQPYFDQTLAAIEREIRPGWSTTVQYVRRSYADQAAYVDRGSVYQPIQRQDPGPDGRLGTADDGDAVTLFEKTNTGQELFVLTNPPDIYRRYDAVQVIARRLYHADWQIQASYTWSRSRGNADNGLNSNSGGPDLGTNGVAADPNRAINADGPTTFDFPHEVKALSSWRIRQWGGVNVSGVYTYHSGMAWGRTVTNFAGIPFVTFGVRVEPRGSRRTAALNNLDLRVEKTFAMPRVGRLGVFGDVFNIGNQGIEDPTRRLSVNFRSGPALGQPAFWVTPRLLRAGVRLTF